MERGQRGGDAPASISTRLEIVRVSAYMSSDIVNLVVIVVMIVWPFAVQRFSGFEAVRGDRSLQFRDPASPGRGVSV
jgi:hypothetical protein